MHKFIMLVGLPASGKSTLAQNIAKEQNANIHSSDEIRKELSGDINNQDINKLVFKTLHNRVKEDLQNGRSCIYDATNISYKRRMAFLQELNKIPCEKICVLMATPYEECLHRNKFRNRQVPVEVLDKMYRHFDVPWYYEGWDFIDVVYSFNAEHSYGSCSEWAEDFCYYNQHNSHHALTLGEHCKQAVKFVDKNDDDILHYATMIHDNGKIYCQTFQNSKGEITEQAHYYDHQNVGGYNALFYAMFDKMPQHKLYVAVLVRWHMQLYFIKEAKTLNKYKRLWGDALYNDLLLLHEADKEAH